MLSICNSSRQCLLTTKKNIQDSYIIYLIATLCCDDNLKRTNLFTFEIIKKVPKFCMMVTHRMRHYALCLVLQVRGKP